MKRHIPHGHCSAAGSTVSKPCRFHGRLDPTVVLSWECGVREAWDCMGRQIEPPRKETK